jgi:hypothetical protein
MPLDSLTNGPFLGTTRNPYSYDKIEQVSRDLQTAWLSLDEITQQLNLFEDQSQDGYLQGLELATRMTIEDYLGMSIFPITYKVYYGTFNGMTGTQMSLDLPEVSQDFQGKKGTVINEVAYYSGATPPVYTVIPKTNYYYDPTGNKVIVSGIPDSASQIMTSPIVCTYTCNANPIAQYPVIKQAGLLLLTHLYNNRSNSFNGKLADIPYGVDQLLRPYKPLVM